MPKVAGFAPPITHHVDVAHALESLDHLEMIALANMFERWAFTEEKLDGEQRTKLIQWSSDYEQIARYCGPDWTASSPDNPPSLMAFVASGEVRAVRAEERAKGFRR